MSDDDRGRRVTRVLLLSPFFHPEPISTGRYNTHLAQALRAVGCRVDVIASHPLYPDWVPHRADASLPGIAVHRGGAWVRYPRAALARRAVLELWFALHVLVQAWRLRGQADVVVPVFPPSLFFYLLMPWLARRVRAVGIVHDLQGLYARGGGRGRRLLARPIEFVERRALQRCDRVIFVSQSMARVAAPAYGLRADRVQVAYPFVTVGAPAPGAPVLPDLPGARHVVYAGALGEKQNPEGLATVIAMAVARHPAWHFHLRSSGPAFEQLRADSRLRGLPRVHFGPLVVEEDLPRLYAQADLNLVPQAPGTAEGSLPSKLPNILACGGRVLAIGDAHSEVLALVAELRAGAGVPSWEPAVVVDAIARELQAPRAGTPAAGLDPAILERFDVQRVVAQILGKVTA